VSAQRHPLTWPTGWPRTLAANRQRADFRKVKTEYGALNADNTRDVKKRELPLAPGDAAARLERELDRLGASDALLSTNLKLRLDGAPRGDQGEPSDPGAAVYFTLKKQPRCLACDRWTRVADNIAALAQHIDALRRIDRYGVGSLEQAFAGYAALPPTAVDWPIVLGVPTSASRDEIVSAHRKLAARHHPDKGGRLEDMARINAARDVALASGGPS
jgi:hypothetical protein